MNKGSIVFPYLADYLLKLPACDFTDSYLNSAGRRTPSLVDIPKAVIEIFSTIQQTLLLCLSLSDTLAIHSRETVY